MHPQAIPPPEGNLSNKPDRATRKALDLTGVKADHRVLFINVGFLKYGTNDKTHAAALTISLILLPMIIAIIVAGFFTDKAAWTDKVFGWLASTFLFSSGIALGRGGKDIHPHPDD